MKIQINSLAALERLIGGDSNVELEIRENIVQEFAKKHLKPLANDELIKKHKEDIQRDISAVSSAVSQEVEHITAAEFGKFKKDSWGKPTGFILSPEVKETVVNSAREQFRPMLAQLVEEAAQRYMKPETIERLLDERIKGIIADTERKVRDQLLKNLAK